MMMWLFLLVCHEKADQVFPSCGSCPSLSLSLSYFYFLPLSRRPMSFQLCNSPWLMAVINEIMKPLYLFIVLRPQAAGLPNGNTECPPPCPCRVFGQGMALIVMR